MLDEEWKRKCHVETASINEFYRQRVLNRR
jgi:hypothetical protein